mmetsp:Transcript_55523/g.110064  ORF Transcript_55523/g.110064 Transcript_55523/m.110064 type:complete len:310 (-) Transcript_55523:158-1087(-)
MSTKTTQSSPNIGRQTRAVIAAAGTSTPPEQGIVRGSANNGVWSQAGQTPLSDITPVVAEPIIGRANLKPIVARLSLSSVLSQSDSDGENSPSAATRFSGAAVLSSSTSAQPLTVGSKKEYLHNGQWRAATVAQILPDNQSILVEVTDSKVCQEDQCSVCDGSTNFCEEAVLICDRCDCETHLACSGLDRVPKRKWFCRDCTQTEQRISIPISEVASVLRDCRATTNANQGTGANTTKKGKLLRKRVDDCGGGVLAMLSTESRTRGEASSRRQQRVTDSGSRAPRRSKREKGTCQLDSLQRLSLKPGSR